MPDASSTSYGFETAVSRRQIASSGASDGTKPLGPESTEVLPGPVEPAALRPLRPVVHLRWRTPGSTHPLFEPQADARHLDKVERLLGAWVDFVEEGVNSEADFKTFEMDGRHG